MACMHMYALVFLINSFDCSQISEMELLQILGWRLVVSVPPECTALFMKNNNAGKQVQIASN